MARVWTERIKSRAGDLFPIVAVGRRWTPLQDLYHRVLDLRWGYYFGSIALLFFAGNALFAALYLIQSRSITGSDGSFHDAFFFSVQTMGTIGYGVMSPATTYGHILVTIEALSGLLGFAVVTGVTFSKFARPTSRVLFSRKICVGSRDGERFMMFRMANERHNQIVEANLRVLILQNVITKEGEQLRVPSELVLVRSRTGFFRLTWTATHRIDEKSPFYGEDVMKRLRDVDTAIYLSVTGLDETIAQTVHARYAYALDDIEWGARFADVIKVEPGGVRVIDYRYFHDVVREEKPAA